MDGPFVNGGTGTGTGAIDSAAGDPRPAVRIGFAGFWDDFDPRDNFFTRLLAPHFRLEFSESPDFLVYSYVGGRRKDYLRHDCVRIFYTARTCRPTGTHATGPSRSSIRSIHGISGCHTGRSTPTSAGW